MIKKIGISLVLLASMFTTFQEVRAEEKTENLFGFDAKSDLRVGPVVSMNYPVSVSNSNVAYNPGFNVNFYGESFNFGSTGFNFSWISSTRGLSTDASQVTNLKFSDVSPATGVSKVNKNLLLLTLSSPINYSPGNAFEFGWLGGIFSQFVTPNSNISGDSGSNLGLNLGGYFKLYQFYPMVPYVNGKIIAGNMYDNGKTKQVGTLSSSIKGGYLLSGGLDVYITKRILINVGYNLINPDFYTLSPTKAPVTQPGQTNTNPKDDTNVSYDEQMQGISASVGFLF